MKSLRIIMLSTSVGLGGADQQIRYLSRLLVSRGHDVKIVSLLPLGPIGQKALEEGADIISLGMIKQALNFRSLLNLLSLITTWKPDVIVSFMYHANLLGRLIRLFTRVPVNITSIRTENLGGKSREKFIRLTDRLCDVTVLNSAHVKKK